MPPRREDKSSLRIWKAPLEGAFGKAGNNLPWLQATRRYAYDLLEDLDKQYQEVGVTVMTTIS